MEGLLCCRDGKGLPQICLLESFRPITRVRLDLGGIEAVCAFMINKGTQQDSMRSDLDLDREVQMPKQESIACMGRDAGGRHIFGIDRPMECGPGLREDVMGQRILAQPVRGLQYMLRRLSGYYQFMPELKVDGIFGEKTLEAVMRFQQELHLPVTGIVDWGTWNAVRDKWMDMEKQLANPRALRAFPGEKCWVEPGADKEFMILPQTMFLVLSRQFNGIAPYEADGIHGTTSSDNVRWLQRAAGMEETGIMDAVTWAVLCNLYEIFVVGDVEDSRAKFVGGWG